MVRVRKSEVTTVLNGKTVFEHRGSSTLLHNDKFYEVPRTDQLFLGIGGPAKWSITALTLTPAELIALVATTPNTTAEVDLLPLVQLPRCGPR